MAAAPTPFEPLLRLSCTELDGATDAVSQQAAELAQAVDSRRGGNFIALGVGVMMFWPALAAIRSNEPEAAELALLKGEYEALRQASHHKDCPAPGVQLLPPLPDDGVQRGTPRVGDRYVYEDFDPISGASLGLSEQRVRSLRGARIEFSGAAPDAGSWTTDVAGNWRGGAAPGLRLLDFLRPDPVPGQRLSGQMAAADALAGLGNIQGRVTALHTHTVQGRRFEAARIELDGQVLSQSSQTESLAGSLERVDGWLLVERRTGQVLQAELHSRNPAFAWRRNLLRFERGG